MTDLSEQVHQFHKDVSATLKAVLGDEDVDLRVTESAGKLAVVTAHPRGIVLKVGGRPLLRLTVKFRCGWDSDQRYLTVRQAEFHVWSTAAREALFRYEFVRDMRSKIPCAHLQIHATRHALTGAMRRSGNRTRRARKRSEAEAPHVSELHFPLGGARFRPPLEDVLQMLVEEFGVDAADGWNTHLCEGRETWRRVQTRAVVRDAPSEAVRTLRDMGYQVEPPPSGPAPDRPERLRAI